MHVAVEDVARAGLNGIENDRAVIVPGFFMKLFMPLVRPLPLFVFRLAARMTK